MCASRARVVVAGDVHDFARPWYLSGMKKNKVAIVGAGSVGATIAYNLSIRGTANELVLIDLNREKAEAECEDIRHGLPLGRPTSITSGGYELCGDAEIVILTAGAKQRPEETRIELLDRNRVITTEIVEQVVRSGFGGVFLVVTNPVDILTYLVQRISGFPPARVVGSGTVLDTSRLRNFLSERCLVSAQNIHGYVLGEHGNTSFPAWSTVTIGGELFERYPELRPDLAAKGRPLADISRVKDEAKEYVRNAAGTIIRGKGSTFYAVAQAVAMIVDAMLRDERRILPVSHMRESRLGSNLAFSFPALVGSAGIVSTLQYELSPDENSELEISIRFIQENCEGMASRGR